MTIDNDPIASAIINAPGITDARFALMLREAFAHYRPDLTHDTIASGNYTHEDLWRMFMCNVLDRMDRQIITTPTAFTHREYAAACRRIRDRIECMTLREYLSDQHYRRLGCAKFERQLPQLRHNFWNTWLEELEQ